MYIISGIFIWHGMVCLVEVGERHQTLDYSRLAVKAFGPHGDKFVDGAIIIYGLGEHKITCILYYVI